MEHTILDQKAVAGVIMDAFPAPLFIVDSDVRLQDANSAAAEFLGAGPEVWGQNLAGEVLGCIHAAREDEKCGRTRFCPNCVVRNSVGAALKGDRVVREWVTMTLVRDSVPKDCSFLVSVTSVELGASPHLLLVLEDVTEIAELRRMIPVCAGCGKARVDDGYWQDVQDYLRVHTAVQFSHGLCPNCVSDLYGEEFAEEDAEEAPH